MTQKAGGWAKLHETLSQNNRLEGRKREEGRSEKGGREGRKQEAGKKKPNPKEPTVLCH